MLGTRIGATIQVAYLFSNQQFESSREPTYVYFALSSPSRTTGHASPNPTLTTVGSIATVMSPRSGIRAKFLHECNLVAAKETSLLTVASNPKRHHPWLVQVATNIQSVLNPNWLI
jgi:hypothetical protein